MRQKKDIKQPQKTTQSTTGYWKEVAVDDVLHHANKYKFATAPCKDEIASSSAPWHQLRDDGVPTMPVLNEG